MEVSRALENAEICKISVSDISSDYGKSMSRRVKHLCGSGYFRYWDNESRGTYIRVS